MPGIAAEPGRKITQDELHRMASWTKPFPFPAYMSPTQGGTFADLDDDTILDTPPQLIAHIQRTAAQGGLQVISPRQCPFTALMNRPSTTERGLSDHVVGSIASPQGIWPTLDDDEEELAFLLPDEPLPVPDHTPALRAKTRTAPLTSANHLLNDPVLACLIKGRAVIDVLGRPDVSGGGEEVATLLATAWGIDRKNLMEMDAFTIGYEGPLLRHAIQADEVYPTCHAPIHQRLSVSVGSSEISREMLPEDSAMDWRRMRVFCEAVFLMSISLEGYPLRALRALPPPGDPSAPLNRPNTLAFRPAPCVAWSFEAKSFAMCPVGTMKPRGGGSIPKEVRAALEKYTAAARPVSYALARGHKLATRATSVGPVKHAADETLSSIYTKIAKTLSTAGARGKTAAATVRNCMYNALESAPTSMQLRIARYMSIAQSECKAHLQVDVVPDRMVDRLAARFLEVGSYVRRKVIAEAAIRGATPEEWWADILSQAPERYKAFTEGTGGWARVAMWLAFRGPTDRWERLVKAMHFSALRRADMESVGGIALPAEKGSVDRLLMAARHVVGAVTRSYAGYYQGVADVGMCLADELADTNRGRSADIIKEAAYLWTLRARAFRGTNVNPLAHGEPLVSVHHKRVSAYPIDLAIVPTPYRAFKSYVTHALESPVVSNTAKALLRGERPGKLSETFRRMTAPICPAKETVVTRYLLRPAELATHMEKAWGEIRSDIAEVARIYGKPPDTAPAKVTFTLPAIFNEPLNLELPMEALEEGDTMNYFEALCSHPQDTVDYIDRITDVIPEAVLDELQERRYTSPAEMLRALEDAEKQHMETEAGPSETVM